MKRYAKVRNIRLKSHQLGITVSHPDAENLQQHVHESIVQDKSAIDEEDKKLIVDETTSKDKYLQSCTASIEDNISQFANSRTLIKS